MAHRHRTTIRTIVLSKDIRDKRVAEANKAWDLLWFVHGLSFNLINSPLFRAAILAIKRCPAYKPCYKITLATTHLDSANDANVFKESRLNSGKTFGFLVTSDGWRNHNRRQYHDFILVAASGPIYLGLKDNDEHAQDNCISGESGNAQAIHDEQSLQQCPLALGPNGVNFAARSASPRVAASPEAAPAEAVLHVHVDDDAPATYLDLDGLQVQDDHTAAEPLNQPQAQGTSNLQQATVLSFMAVKYSISKILGRHQNVEYFLILQKLLEKYSKNTSEVLSGN